MHDKESPAATGLGPFLQRVQQRLDGLSNDELRKLLLEHARQLSVDDRPDFLALLERPVPGDGADATDELQHDPTLLEDIISFIDELQGGPDAEPRFLDAEWELERGDAAWISALDDLFDRSAQVFLKGSRALAAEAFERLLYAFRREESFSGTEDPEDMVVADLPEAKARYLRALYEVTPPPERAQKLVREMAALQWIGARRVALSNVMDADVAPLPGLESFLPSWIAALADAKDVGGFGWETERRRLIREAAVLQGGIATLGELAQSEGADHFEAYHEWVARLHDKGRMGEAISAAREGTVTIRNVQERARMADCLAQLAYRQNDSALLLHARREAWQTHPTHTRLCAFAYAKRPTIPELIERMAAEADAIQQGERRVDDRQAALVFMLAAGYDSLKTSIDAATPRGWSRDQHPAPVVVPFLLVAGSGNTTPRSDTLLWMTRQRLGRATAGAEEAEVSILLEYGKAQKVVESSEAHQPQFKDLVLGVLSTRPPSTEQRKAFLEHARDLIERRIRAVVLGKHLGAYEQAATLLVAWVEAKLISGAQDEALDFLLSIRQAFSRYRTFRAELDSIADSTPIVAEILAHQTTGG